MHTTFEAVASIGVTMVVFPVTESVCVTYTTTAFANLEFEPVGLKQRQEGQMIIDPADSSLKVARDEASRALVLIGSHRSIRTS